MGKAKLQAKKQKTVKHPYKSISVPERGANEKRVGKHPANQKSTASNSGTRGSTPTIPFTPIDRILLIGEGDFSFSASLLTTHACTSLTATSFDDRTTLLQKYPQSASHIQMLEVEPDCTVLFGVDATKIGKPGIKGSGGKEVRKARNGVEGAGPGFDKIVFNFPHVGGLTRDVDRQIRHNQELLLGFFGAAVPLLTRDCESEAAVIVTVFEGEPYQKWDIRGLARDTGLRVGRSFRFSAQAYPGYRHARTLGNIEGGGGWKGEDRPARTFILVRNLHEGNGRSQGSATARKRGREDTDSESE